MHFYFHTVGAFFEMGGYAKYVWSSYAFVFASLLAYWLFQSHRKKKIYRQLKRAQDA